MNGDVVCEGRDVLTIPTWEQFLTPVLTVLSDGNVRRLRQVADLVYDAVDLTEEQRQDELASGQSRAYNRIGWAASYLSRVGALERPTRGQYVITPSGKRLLAEHPSGVSEADIRALARPGDQWWIAKTSTAEAKQPVAETALDPVEQIEEGISRLHANIAGDLLTRLHTHDPAFFEQAVLDLLMAMGYGGAEGAASRTQLSNDGGIDGIVDQDALGLSRIYVQAKRYAPDASVGRPEIQAFVGALHGNQAGQGVFLSTARFSRGAREYAGSVPTRVVLVDGQRLATLMIRYGVGVQIKHAVKIVEIDEDFFE